MLLPWLPLSLLDQVPWLSSLELVLVGDEVSVVEAVAVSVVVE